jgi:hypothetical protein
MMPGDHYLIIAKGDSRHEKSLVSKCDENSFGRIPRTREEGVSETHIIRGEETG